MIKKLFKRIENIGSEHISENKAINNAIILNFTCVLGLYVGLSLSIISLIANQIPQFTISFVTTLLLALGVYFNSKGKFNHTLIICCLITTVAIPAQIFLEGNNGSVLYFLTGGTIISFLSYDNLNVKRFLLALLVAGFLISIFILRIKFHIYPFLPSSSIQFNFNLISSLTAIILAILYFSSLMRKQQEKLIELNEVKNKLLSIISHDIRSPINNLVGLIDMYEEGDLDAQTTQIFIQKISKETKKTSTLLDEILVWAKSQLQGIEPNKSFFGLKELVNQIIANQENSATEKGVKFEIVGSEIIVFADREMIHLALRNIINNAIKFAPSKTGLVGISLETKPNLGLVHVSDNGKGLSIKSIENIKKRKSYTQEGSEQEKGFGIGMLLSQEFIDLNNGVIEIANSKQGGAIFSLEIPLK